MWCKFGHVTAISLAAEWDVSHQNGTFVHTRSDGQDLGPVEFGAGALLEVERQRRLPVFVDELRLQGGSYLRLIDICTTQL